MTIKDSACCHLNCLGLEAHDQDSKGKTKINTETVMAHTNTETKTMKILPRDEAVAVLRLQITVLI